MVYYNYLSGITVKVLKRDASKKYRKDAASVFVKARLGELRAEERRRVKTCTHTALP